MKGRRKERKKGITAAELLMPNYYPDFVQAIMTPKAS
jgi:hypothetical protein